MASGSISSLLPRRLEGQDIRHVVEVRHDSFRTGAFTGLIAKHGVAAVVAGDARYPQIADVTAPFVYVRVMGTTEAETLGYADAAINAWVERARLWSRGSAPTDLQTVSRKARRKLPRDVFLYVISGFKERNPAAAQAMLERLRGA